MLECPRCNGQGHVFLVRVKKTGKILKLCDECDAIWNHDEEVSQESWSTFDHYMEDIGLDTRWDHIDVLGAAE